MEFFRIRRDIPFMRYALIFNIISFATFVLAVAFLVLRGLNFSIEFTGGVVIEARYTEAAKLAEIRTALDRLGVHEPQVQNFGTSRDVMIRLALKDATNPAFAGVDPQTGKPAFDQKKFEAAAVAPGGAGGAITRVEFVGPQVGRELATDGALALLVVCLGIMAYLAMRFEWKFSVAAIIANLHDVVIILGFFAFFQWEFSLSVLAAVLAVLGYSVNESVVVFDRVRETFRRRRGMSVPEVINHAITSTISRTIITHGSTQMMVTTMLIFGGPTLHYFALALTIGILFGIYSSVLVASPIVMWLGISREDLIKPPTPDRGPTDGAVV
ncbi:MAG: protein translocase subunit SecF [Burkholderiales bacterium]